MRNEKKPVGLFYYIRYMNEASPKFREESIAPMHTAEHIVNRAMMRLFGCGRAVEAHIERKKSKLDYALPGEPTAEELTRLEEEVNRVIASDLPVTMEYITQDEAAARFDMARLPERASEDVRVVHVGDYDECLCIGRHVGHTAEIGRFRISTTDYRDGILRLRFKLEQL